MLSSGHVAFALYTVLEKYEGRDAEALLLNTEVCPFEI
jgi:transketolase N-terminal domain/subunit